MPVILIILVVIALLIIGPLLTIWSLNTLFPMLAIPYEFTTWLAVMILAAAMKGNVKVDRS